MMQALTTESTVLLDVGHGNAAVVESGGKVAIIDAGAGAYLLDFLRLTKVKKIHTAIITHADEDHMGGLVGVIASKLVDLKNVYLNGDGTKESRAWDDLAFELDSLTTASSARVHSGTTSNTPPIQLGNVEISFLAPSTYLATKGVGNIDGQGRRIKSNSLSVVVKISAGGAGRVLLTGDLDQVGLDDLREHHAAALRADTLIFPHHGGGTGSDPAGFAEELTRLVRPRILIFSMARRAKPKNPDPEIVLGVRRGHAEAHIMCTQLSLHCSEEVPVGAHLKHLSATPAAGKKKPNVCCAGSITIPHHSIRWISPSRLAHKQYVTTLGDGPLCKRKLD